MKKLKEGAQRKTGRRSGKKKFAGPRRKFVMIPPVNKGDESLGIYLNEGEAEEVTALAFRSFLEKDADRRQVIDKKLRGVLVGIAERQRQFAIMASMERGRRLDAKREAVSRKAED